MYMGFWDRFKPSAPTPAPTAGDNKTITMARKPGTLYFLRARNIKSGFDDILCFDSEIMRRRYIGTARESTPTPGDWYFDEYETTAESRLQQELENQRKALETSYKKDIAKLEYKIRDLQSDKRNLESKLTGGSYLQKYNNSQHALNIVKRELAEERQKNAELLALIQQVKERKQAEQKAPVQTKSAAAILQELQADIERVLSMRNGLDEYLTEYEQELASITNKIPLQGRIIIAMIQRQVNNI
jgi:tRNA nucleotidyltransferase/poly(A) polymerase